VCATFYATPAHRLVPLFPEILCVVCDPFFQSIPAHLVLVFSDRLDLGIQKFIVVLMHIGKSYFH
jgi:hypothetical protein